MGGTQNFPGPGHFSPSDSIFHDMRSTKFGSSKRYEVAAGHKEGPGPGAYTVGDKTLGAAPAYSLKGRNSMERS